MSENITIRAKYNKWHLLQYGEVLFDVCHEKDLPKNVSSVPEKDIKKFSPDDAELHVKNNGLVQIDLLGYISFSTNLNLVVFRHKTTREVSWLMKSKFSSKDSKLIDALLEDEEKDMHEKVKAMNQKPKVEISRSPSVEHSQNRWENIDPHTVVQSSESPDPGYPTLSHTSNSRDTHFGSREMSVFSDVHHRTGETPAPQPGGNIIYGRRLDPRTIRGIVRRNGSCEIEYVKEEECPPELMSSYVDEKGFAPAGDERFLDQHKKKHKLDTSKIDIVGCAAKWHSVRHKMIHIYILFNLIDEGLQEEAQGYRNTERERYRGPIICSWTAFQKSFHLTENDLQVLVNSLKSSKFTQDALAKGLNVEDKILLKPQRQRKQQSVESEQTNEKVSALEKRQQQTEWKIDLMMEKMGIRP